MNAMLLASGPIACLVDAIPSNQRDAHFSLARKLLAEQAEERTMLPNGYAFRFGADLLEKVARFIENERKCCPFLTFEIALAADAGPLWLRMTGPDGAREIIEAELHLGGCCAGTCGTSNG